MATDIKPAEPQPIDISNELWRVYTYGDGTKYKISYPEKLYIMASGGHRVVDAEGVTHAPRNPWAGISWKQSDGKPFSF